MFHGVGRAISIPTPRRWIIAEPHEQSTASTGRIADSLARRRWRRIAKRGLDLAAASGLLVLCGPLMLVIAALIRATSRGPVFFLQKRLGIGGTIFSILKFRTMVNRAWEQGAGLRIAKNDERITLLGRLLRISHMDELPQLINVLKGEMSLVGPRPTLPFHYDYYEPWEKLRQCRPASLGPRPAEQPPSLGTSASNWYVWYVQHWSLGLDAELVHTATGPCSPAVSADPRSNRRATGDGPQASPPIHLAIPRRTRRPPRR